MGGHAPAGAAFLRRLLPVPGGSGVGGRIGRAVDQGKSALALLTSRVRLLPPAMAL